MATVDTSTTNDAIQSDSYAYASNGVKWVAYDNGSNIELEYDSGSGWTSDGTVGSAGKQANLFIDEDDYAHLVMYDSGRIDYYRGTPNGGITSWTWAGPTAIEVSDNVEHNPRVVAHSEGTGWKAHVIWGAKDQDYWETGTWWYRRKCDHPSGGHAHLHTRTCGGWTTGTPAGCSGFGSHSHYNTDSTCGPSCESWPNNGNPQTCNYTLLTSHNHGVTDAGTDSYYEVTDSGWDYYNRVYYQRVDITSGQVVSLDGSAFLVAQQTNYDESHPFIDFAHSGDGKTPLTNRHVYVGWNNKSGETVYRRLEYSAGPSWAWDSPINIDTGNSQGYAVGGWNGNDFVIFCRNPGATNNIEGWRIDGSLESPTPVQYASIANMSGTVVGHAVALVNDTVYLFGIDGTDGDLELNVYDGSWSGWTTLVTSTLTGLANRNCVGTNKHPTDGTAQIFYLDGTGSPYNLDIYDHVYQEAGAGVGVGFIPIGG
ncbi:MAG: hypothetical protein JSW51_03070 [Gemmatimonadota bacterium]|nr:MAG: hypothetical protein EP299_01700 [Acidobacteriota bacterium]UCD24916.1 MAG: hypothetical protein JSW51_03070 [Gemmatimonadota bacterium]